MVALESFHQVAVLVTAPPRGGRGTGWVNYIPPVPLPPGLESCLFPVANCFGFGFISKIEPTASIERAHLKNPSIFKIFQMYTFLTFAVRS